MNLVFSDNIVAEMTPSGRGAVSGIRISGPGSKDIVESIFGIKIAEPNYLYHVKHHLDDVVLAYYKAPRSYTGQDACEIFCHGNPSIVNLIMDSMLSLKGYKVRIANPGEFTKIAYLNGKMDLMQAEAVLDLINSSTKQAVEYRNKTLRGELSQKIVAIRGKLLELAVKAELEIDFEEDKAGVFNYDVAFSEIKAIKNKIDNLINSFKNIEKLSGDIKVLITGKANVGKSSLFNKILEYERSIVHHLPGTTRDYIEADIILGDFEVTFIDTAGLRDGYDSDVEAKGAEKIHELMKKAFLTITVVIDDECYKVSKKEILVRNKVDINAPAKKDKNTIYLSAYTGEGIDLLKKEVEERVKDYVCNSADNDDMFLLNKRQLLLVSRLGQELESIVGAVKGQENIDIISFLIRNAIRTIDEMTGKENLSDEVLDELFSKFCIGK